jgi:TonB family protein
MRAHEPASLSLLARRAALAALLGLGSCARTSAGPTASAPPGPSRPSIIDPSPSLDLARYCAEAASQVTSQPPASPDGGEGGSIQLASIPKLISEPKVAYPPAALAAGSKEAQVILRVHIDRAGTTGNVRVLRSAGPELDRAATEAVYQLRFTPACTTTGQPVPVQITYTVRFMPEPEPPVQR